MATGVPRRIASKAFHSAREVMLVAARPAKFRLYTNLETNQILRLFLDFFKEMIV